MVAKGWELYLDNAATDPHDEAHVIRMIAAGLPEQTLIRESGAADWRGLRSHAPFAVALERRGAPSSQASPPAPSPPGPYPAAPPLAPPSPALSGAALVVSCIIGALVILVVIVRSLGSEIGGGREASPPPAVIEPPVFTPQNPKRAVTAAPQNPLDIVMTKATLPEALSVARPLMIDRPNDSAPGTFLLALWSLKHLTWKDVGVATDETSFGKVAKNPNTERGKRLCASGAIVEISAAEQPYGTLYVGLLGSDSGNLFHFNAVKSTGNLVQQSYARFCGIVGGPFDYENSGGGVGHAIDMVGMFDLPENRK